MYKQDLGDKVLEQLHRSFPDSVSLEALRAALPEYAGLPDVEWHSMFDALSRDGLVEGTAVRSGAAGKVGALYDLRLTKLGKSEMDELFRLLELGDLKFKQVVKGLYDDIVEGDGVRRVIGAKFGGWNVVPSQAIPHELAALVTARFACVKGTFKESFIQAFYAAEGGVTSRGARWLNRKLRSVLPDQKNRAASLLGRLLESFGVPLSVAGALQEELQVRCVEIADSLSDQIRLAELGRRLGLPEPEAAKAEPPETGPGTTDSHSPTHSDLSGRAQRVFVVHGRDERLRKGIFDFLRAIGLHPMEWGHAIALTGSASPYIGEILDAAFNHAQAVVALLSPDDEAKLRADLIREDDPPYEKSLAGQARPNVLFEAGMALASHPDHTVLVQIGPVRPFSDVAGRHAVRMDNSAAKRKDLAQRLQNARCSVNLQGDDWLTAGDLTPPPEATQEPSWAPEAARAQTGSAPDRETMQPATGRWAQPAEPVHKEAVRQLPREGLTELMNEVARGSPQPHGEQRLTNKNELARLTLGWRGKGCIPTTSVTTVEVFGEIENLSPSKRITEYSFTLSVPKLCLSWTSGTYALEVASPDADYRRFRDTEHIHREAPIYPGDRLQMLSVDIAVGHLPPEDREKCLKMEITGIAAVDGEALQTRKTVAELVPV